MILEEETFEAFGYYVSELKPKTHKPIIAICELCGEFRIIPKCGYHTFCNSCSQRLNEKNKGNTNSLGYKHTEDAKAKISVACSAENHYMFNKHLSEEHKAKLSAANKGKKHSEEEKCEISKALKGENNPNWQGGISFEPYCVKFNNTFKEYIRSKFGYKCFLCPTTQAENGRRLCVHHVNYNKNCGCDGDKTCQFVPLCISCHSKTGADRDYWQALIMEMLKPLEAWS